MSKWPYCYYYILNNPKYKQWRRATLLCDVIWGNQSEVEHVTFSDFYLTELNKVLIWRGTSCWKPHLNQTSGSKVMSNWTILKTIENKRNSFLFLAISHYQCSQLLTDSARSQHIWWSFWQCWNIISGGRNLKIYRGQGWKIRGWDLPLKNLLFWDIVYRLWLFCYYSRFICPFLYFSFLFIFFLWIIGCHLYIPPHSCHLRIWYNNIIFDCTETGNVNWTKQFVLKEL